MGRFLIPNYILITLQVLTARLPPPVTTHAVTTRRVKCLSAYNKFAKKFSVSFSRHVAPDVATVTVFSPFHLLIIT